MRHLTLITTGGTIEKTYDETSGELSNRRSIVGRMLRRLRLEDTSIAIIELMSKDSLYMTDEDRSRVVGALRAAGADCAPPNTPPTHGVIVLHGTDTLNATGEAILKAFSSNGGGGREGAAATTLRVPVILTGAMRPYEMTRSDALQNLTEAIFATGVVGPGVYAAAHGRLLAFPGVTKDRSRMTFVKDGK